MSCTRLIRLVVPLLPILFASAAQAQGGDIYWHIDPSVKTCSMVIDPALTQAQWHTFTQQVGAIAGFKSLTSAEPLGRMNFTIAATYSSTPVNQRDPAWINTFTHPGVGCPLGDQIKLPTLRAGLGLSNRMDVGACWATAPGANYGLLGGELKYALLRESGGLPAAAVSASYATLTGVPDFDLSVYSAELVASKRVAMLTPYVGVRQGLSVGTETTTKVDLTQERIPFTQGFFGATWSIWKVGIAAEYNVASVNTFALVIGYLSGAPSR